MSEQKDVLLSQFNPSNIMAQDLSECPTGLSIDDDGMLVLTGSKGSKQSLGKYQVPAGKYLTNAYLDVNGHAILLFSDGTQSISDVPIVGNRAVQMELEGTGIFTGVSGNKLLFEPITISYPFKVENGVIVRETNAAVAPEFLDASKYVGVQDRVVSANKSGMVKGNNFYNLNTSIGNTIGATFSNGGLLLPAGKYYAKAVGRHYRFATVQLRLMRDTAVVLSVWVSSGSGSGISDAVMQLSGVFTIPAPSLIRLANFANTHEHSNINAFGLAHAKSAANPFNVYGQLELWRLD